MSENNLIAKGTVVRHHAEDILARVAGYINFEEMGLGDYAEMRYVLRGLDSTQHSFREGHECRGARQYIDWYKDYNQRYTAGYWYATEDDFTVMPLPEEQAPVIPGVDTSNLLPAGTEIKFRANLKSTCTGRIVGYVFKRGICLYTVFNEKWSSFHNSEGLRGHDGFVAPNIYAPDDCQQVWLEEFDRAANPSYTKSFWFVATDDIVARVVSPLHTEEPYSPRTTIIFNVELGATASVTEEGVIVGWLSRVESPDEISSYVVRNNKWERRKKGEFRGHDGSCAGLSRFRYQIWDRTRSEEEEEEEEEPSNYSYWFVRARDITGIIQYI